MTNSDPSGGNKKQRPPISESTRRVKYSRPKPEVRGNEKPLSEDKKKKPS